MPKPKILDTLIPFFLLCFTLTIYILTLSRSVYFGDSGEFITAAYTLGIAHPPGYPLYTMLAHLFTYLPFGNLPFKVNFFSAISSSLTVVVVYFICLKITANRLASASASLFLAFSYSFWLYSLIADTYSLNTFFIAVLVLISLHLFANPNKIRLFWFLAFAFGLSLSHHAVVLFLAPALAFIVILSLGKQILNVRLILPAVLLFVLGLLPYIYLPIRAFQNPSVNWGDPDTVGKFTNHVLRYDYGTFAFSSGADTFNFDVLLFYFQSLFWHFAAVGVVIAVLGLILSLQNKKLFGFLAISYLFLGPILIFLTRVQVTGSIDTKAAVGEFLSASYVIIAIFIGLGIGAIYNLFSKRLKPLAIISVAFFAIPLFINFAKVDQSNNFLYENFSQELFNILPKNAILLISSDKGMMAPIYLQTVGGIRSDIKIVNFTLLPANWYKENLKQRYPQLVFPWDKFTRQTNFSEAAKTICDQVVPNYPIYIDSFFGVFTPNFNQSCSYIPYGPVVKLDKQNTKMTNEEINQNQNYWNTTIVKLKQQKPADYRTRQILRSYSEYLTYFGISLQELGKQDMALEQYKRAYEISADYAPSAHFIAQYHLSENKFDEAIVWEQKSIESDPRRPEPYNNLGFIYYEQKKDNKKAYFYFQKYLDLAPNAQDRDRIEKLVKKIKRRRKVNYLPTSSTPAVGD